MRKQLLFIMGSLENGGGERSLINLLQLIDYSKYDVDLVLFKKKGFFLKQVPETVNILDDVDILQFMYKDTIKESFSIKNLRLSIVHIIGTIVSKALSKSGFHKGQYRWKHFYKKIIPRLNKNYDTAISYLEGETTFYLVDKVTAKKKIAWVHTDYSKINADMDFDLEYFKKIDNIVSISDVCVNVLKNYFVDIADRFVCLANLTSSKTIKIMSDQFIPCEFLNDENLRILSIGRLIELKGFDIALEAARILKENNIKFKWYVIGDGILKDDLETKRKKYQLENNFEFLGVRENPYPYIKGADIIVQPSRYEGKSMVLDEAKILCKPIVVTKYDTVFDQINEREGIIVNIDASDLAKGIMEMIPNRDKYINYLKKHEYGNQNEITKYYSLFDT
ncbi:glycosyltransferase [Agathobacter sp. LCP21S3_B2]|uniref:glycosyltransferase n=1 Tax=Agathobacter sp. LCP21S3_B2 TaxID=3438734 RepID=UPI003F90CCB5